MLLLDSELQVGPVTIFRDHVAAETFHYMPGNPRVVIERDGPRAQLVQFRSDNKGGGFLALEVDLALNADTLAKTRDALATQFSLEPNLVPVLFTRGTARISTLDFNEKTNLFVEGVLGTATPSLLGHQSASFSVQLTSEGSTLVAAALKTGTAPVLIVYDLEYSGLAPGRNVRAKVQYKMAYSYLRNRFTMNSLYFRADLDKEIEQLSKQGNISIEDVDFIGVDAATRASRAEEVRATLTKLMEGLFFQPAPQPASLVAAGGSISPNADKAWASNGRPQLAFLLRAMNQQEQETLTYDLTQTRLETRNIAPQGVIRLPAGTDLSKLIQQTTIDWPPPVTAVRAFTSPDADWSGVSAIQVDLRQNEKVTTIVLTPADHDRTVNVVGPLEYSVSPKFTPEPDALGLPPKPDLSFHPLPGPNLFFDPVIVSGRRELRILMGVVDASVVIRVAGTVQLADASRHFQLSADQPEVTIAIWGQDSVRLHAEFAVVGGQRISVDRDVAAIDQAIVLNQPADQFHVVSVMLQDPLNRYGSVSVTLEAADGAPRRNVVLDSAGPVGQWSALRDSKSPDTFRYSVKQVMRNASTTDLGWKEASGSLLVVGDLDIRIETVQGYLLGAGETLGGLIHFEPIDAPAGIDAALDIVLDPGQTSFQANLAFAKAAPRSYTVSGQIFQANGTVDLPAWKDTAEVLLITPPKTRALTPAH